MSFQGNIFTTEDDVGSDENENDAHDGKDHRDFAPDEEAQDCGENDAGVAVNGKLAGGGVLISRCHQKLEYGSENSEGNQLEQLEGGRNDQVLEKHDGNAAQAANGGIP